MVLKIGEHGVYLASNQGLQIQVPAFPVKAVDTTAAGDAFNGVSQLRSCWAGALWRALDSLRRRCHFGHALWRAAFHARHAEVEEFMESSVAKA